MLMIVTIVVKGCVIKVCNGRSLSRGQCEDGSDEEVDCCLEQVSFSYRTGAKKNKVQTA